MPTALTVNDCIGDSCILIARQPLYAVASGVLSRYTSKTATTRVVSRFLGLDTGYRLPREYTDACKGGISGGCPVYLGETYNFTLAIDDLVVPDLNIPVEVEVSVRGDKGVVLGCVRFKAKVVKSD